MEGNDYSYGEIHILTELVYIDPIELKRNSATPVILLRKKPPSSISISVNSYLRNIDDVRHVWWPCRSFMGIYQGLALFSFAYVVLRVDEAVLADFQDCHELSGSELFIPWWQVIGLYSAHR